MVEVGKRCRMARGESRIPCPSIVKKDGSEDRPSTTARGRKFWPARA
jgi:hypothetical protein